jgi:hypothetical protein
MRIKPWLLIFLTFLVLISCAPEPETAVSPTPPPATATTITATAVQLTATAPAITTPATLVEPPPGLPAATAAPPTATAVPQGRTLLVTSPADSGSGTLRQALLDAQSRDTITFDPAIFLPDTPVIISVTSYLPPINQGNLTIDASDMELGLDVVVGMDGFDPNATWRYPVMRNLNRVMAGNKPIKLVVEIESDATNIMSFGFTLPNGDRLFALWTNGVAVEDDPGVSATLTFPDLSAQRVIGIDVLHGFEQELIFEMENGNLVIRNLLVKDYPIILRLID